jgi:hypothetical protein
MTTYFEAQLALSRILQDTWESVATGGSTTTVTDTLLNYPSGYFSDQPRGTLFLDLTVKATKIITVHATTTLTFSPAQGAVIAAGNVYAAAPGIFPKHILEQSIKVALQRIGKVPKTKDVTMVVNQQEWDNTDDVIFDEEVIGVEFAGNAASPYGWTPNYNWYQVQKTIRTLIFEDHALPPTTNLMRVFYLGDHAAMATLATGVSSYINLDRLVWTAAVHALRWRIQKIKQVSDGSTEISQLMTEARENLVSQSQEQLVEAEQKMLKTANLYPIVRQHTPHHPRW